MIRGFSTLSQREFRLVTKTRDLNCGRLLFFFSDDGAGVGGGAPPQPATLLIRLDTNTQPATIEVQPRIIII